MKESCLFRPSKVQLLEKVNAMPVSVDPFCRVSRWAFMGMSMQHEQDYCMGEIVIRDKLQS